jgi:hypothetical protein
MDHVKDPKQGEYIPFLPFPRNIFNTQLNLISYLFALGTVILQLRITMKSDEYIP